MMSTLRKVKAKLRCYRTYGGGGGEEVSDFLDVESFFFLLKKIGFDLKMNILLTRYLLFDSDVRQ